MSRNLEILKAQRTVHNLQCLISLMRKTLTGPDQDITFNENEAEAMLDQFDEMYDRLERLNTRLDALKDKNPPFDVVKDGKNVVNILAKKAGNPKKTTVSTISSNGNGKGKFPKAQESLSDMSA